LMMKSSLFIRSLILVFGLYRAISLQTLRTIMTDYSFLFTIVAVLIGCYCYNLSIKAGTLT
jgi:hypothetical protein